MRMLMIGGGAPDEARLRAMLQTAGLAIEIGRLPAELRGALARAVDADALAAADTGHHTATPEAVDPGPRALLFEAPLGLDIALEALRVMRADRCFAATVAIVCVDIEHSDGFERVRGFDDFVSGPWKAPEVWARIVAAERRRETPEADSLIQIGGVWLDRRAREAQVEGRSVRLTAREFALFTYLCMRRGCVLSRSQVLEHVWGHGYGGGQRTVDVHIRRLRSKLGQTLRIDTVRSGGYRLCAETQPTMTPGDLDATPANRTGSAGRSGPLVPLGSRAPGRRWPFSRCASF
jgi:DNA-binding response OmpR family regulator